MPILYHTKLIPYARNLRANMTTEEKKLWYDFLSSYPIRFQRQKPIDTYIADFYCHKATLIIELDGSQHYEDKNRKYDEVRTIILNNLGYTVMRFTNLDIRNEFEGVCIAIDKVIKEKLGIE